MQRHRLQFEWTNIVVLLVIHVFGIHGLVLKIISAQWKTVIYALILGYIFSLGVTAGAHRLWSHRTYKAKLPLQILLCFLHSMCLQGTVFQWVKNHRVHHKFADTNADPHNVKRGFFFSHMGWLMVSSHPDFIKAAEIIDMSEFDNDSVIQFQKKNHLKFAPLISLFIPALVPYYFWAEDCYTSWTVSCMCTLVRNLHYTWAVNSFAHQFGYRPYDKNILPAENYLVHMLTGGEGNHNFHHTFPQDYRGGEWDLYGTTLVTAFIDLMERLGWAYDLKTASQELISQRKRRTGTK